MGRKPVDVLRVVMAVSAALFLFVLAMPTLAVGESDSSSNTFPMYRVYNRWSGEHLFTADAGEYASLGSIGWKQGGVAWKSPASGNPVWRLYNPYSGNHFYTGRRVRRVNRRCRKIIPAALFKHALFGQ